MPALQCGPVPARLGEAAHGGQGQERVSGVWPVPGVQADWRGVQGQEVQGQLVRGGGSSEEEGEVEREERESEKREGGFFL